MDKKLQDYLIMDNQGMVVEKTDNLLVNQNCTGYISDIINKTRSVLKGSDSVNSIEIFYENQTIMIKDNCSNNLNITTLLANK
jgi:hypothetical protein